MRNKIAKGLLLFCALLVFIGIGSAAQALVDGSFIPTAGSYKRGDTIAVDVMLSPSQTYTMSIINAYTYYDTKVLAVDSLVDYYPNGWSQSALSDEPLNGRVKYTKGSTMANTPLKNQSKPVKIYTINFKVKDTAPINASTAINLGDPLGHFWLVLQDEDETDLTGTRTPSTFNIVDNGPTLSGISPATGEQGKTITVTLTGTNNTWNTWSGDVKDKITFNNKKITVNSATVTNANTLSASITIASDATLGGDTVSVTGSTGTPTFTVTAPPVAPVISNVVPATANPGQTIVITGTKFGTYVSNATTNVKIGGVTANPASWSDTSIVLSVPKGVASPAGVVVTTAKGSSNSYTITTNSSVVVIDDVEGGTVGTWNLDFDLDGKPDSGSYKFDQSLDCTYAVSSTYKEGAKSFSVKYVYNGSDGTSWGGGCGSLLTNAQDISSKNTVSFWLKGDGTTNEVSLRLQATYEGTGIQIALPAVKLNNTSWTQYSYNLTKCTIFDVKGEDTVDLTPTQLTNYLKKITNYNLAYTTKYANSSNAYHYIDGIKASYVTPNVPPVASPVAVSTDINKEVEITLKGTDKETPAGSLKYYIVTLPAKGGTLNVPVGLISGNKVTYTPKKDATGADTFTYKVNDGTDDSNTATVTVNIANNDPNAFDLLEPAKDATDIAVKPTFKWEASTDPDGDTPIHYTLKVSEASDLSSPVIDTKTDDTSYTAASDLKFNTPYYWQVTADDGKGGSANSETWSFTTEDSLKVTGVLPAEATLGQTIVISGTNLGTSGTVTVGGAATYPVSWKANEIILAVPSGVTAGAAEVVATSADGLYSSKGSVSVKTDSIMLDDYEGGAVGNFDPSSPQKESGYYVFEKSDDITPNNSEINSKLRQTTVKQEGAYAAQVKYSYVGTDGTDWGGGWGAKLANIHDISAMNRIQISIQWDGSANSSDVSLSLKDKDGTAVLATLPSSALKSDAMSDIVINKKSLIYAKDSSDSSADDKFDYTQVASYNLVYKGKEVSSNSHYIDNLQAYAVDETKPELSVTPDTMSFTGYVGGTSISPATLPITISNAMPDTGEFKFSLAATVDWISLSPTEGTTVGETAQATVSINKIPGDEGIYTAEVTVAAEDGVQGSPKTVKVTLQVKKTTSPPTITSLSTNKAPAGTRITIKGDYFGASQEQSRVVFTKNGVGADGRVISWSDNQIEVETPGTLAIGSYKIEILRISVAAEGIMVALKSNLQDYNVSAASVIGLATIYPNPINPNKAETVTILFDNQGVNNITVYIYDATARLIKQEDLATGANQTTWNGKDASGSVAGDGVYLVRIVNRDSRSLIARGKILVVKR